ncbi:MAG: 7,8-didemethyl-8-hydroxy-5-deazariboflavin synthase CofG [bacterium]|nr:7,8-didemethyl-8-hydroxy-5-deazariboflavin synthase CofG [bacterium]
MALTRAEQIEAIRKAVDAEPLGRGAALEIAWQLDREPEAILQPLLEAAQELGIRGHGREITVSRNVFIPLTNLCRNRCGYCTFAVQPDDPDAHTWPLSDVRAMARKAFAAGCPEALFCLGDKPEVAYRGYRGWLQEQGFANTTAYLIEACRVAYEQGVFPHTNAGIMSAEELTRLRPFNASMGLMLETVSPRLRQKGEAHYYCPDKEPELRLRMTREAGELKIPFTSGILIGIGETPAERVDTLLAIRELHNEGGHIQEVIVQNFHPKSGTALADLPMPSDELMAGTVALARLLLGPQMNLQAPPNLSPTSLELLVRSGLNDWGGVSPVTIDFINPEAPWPELEELRARTRAAGYTLRDRHCVYPAYIVQQPEFFDPEMLRRLRAASDADGYPLPPSSASEGA